MTTTIDHSTLPENDRKIAADRLITKANNSFTALSRLIGVSENRPSTALRLIPRPAPK
jgi:hypothetical protein